MVLSSPPHIPVGQGGGGGEGKSSAASKAMKLSNLVY
jgi:hypothetical protein